MKKNERGVLTVEASLVLGICTLFILFIFSFARVYSAQSLVGHAVLQSSDAVALESYLRETAYFGSEEDVVELANRLTGSTSVSASSFTSLRSADVPKIAKEKFVYAIAGSEAKADEKLKNLGVKDGLAGVDFSGSYMDLGNDDVIVSAKYTIEMQFPVFGFKDINVTKAAKSKTFGDILFNLEVIPNDVHYGTVSGGGKYTYGTEVEIVATPYYGYKFMGWDTNDDGKPDTSASLKRKVIVSDHAKYVAIFETDLIPIKLYVNNENGGSVEGNGACVYKKSWNIKATPKEGYNFVGWSGYWYEDKNGNGKCDNGETKNTVKLGDDKAAYTIPEVKGIYELTANFEIKRYNISVEVRGGVSSDNVKLYIPSTGETTSSKTLVHGTIYDITVKGTPDGYRFVGWKTRVNNKESDYTGDISRRIADRSVTWIAVYEINPSIQIKGEPSGDVSAQLYAETTPGNVKVTWSSSHPDIISVDQNGKITAVGYSYDNRVVKSPDHDYSVTGKNVTVYITGSFSYNGKTYSDSVVVKSEKSYELRYYMQWYENLKTRYYYINEPDWFSFHRTYHVTKPEWNNANVFKDNSKAGLTGPLGNETKPQTGINMTGQQARIYHVDGHYIPFFIVEIHGSGDYYISDILD